MRYRCTIAYDGTDYAGWQRQKHCANTITQVLEDSFEAVFKEKIALTGASRTDSGVHALGQVATFESELGIEPAALQEAWNNRLPAAIVVRDIEASPEGFHPQRNVKQKIFLLI